MVISTRLSYRPIQTTKMVVPAEKEQSGIYEVVYQTTVRSAEQLRAFKNGKPQDSAIAQHMLNKDDHQRTYNVNVTTPKN
jgi:hypothetical protein